MTLSFEDIVKFLNYLTSRKRTKIGYALFVIFIFLLGLFVPPFNTLDLLYRFCIFILLSIAGFIFWLFLSGRCYFPSDKILIGISLKSFNPNSQSVINITLMRLKDQLKALNLLNLFKIVEIGTDAFSSNDEAEKFASKKKLVLVIHGTVYDGKYGDKYSYDLKNFFFTYRVPAVTKESPLFKIIQTDINIICQHRDWNIEESNSIIDIQRVANNLFEIVLSIIAIALCHSAQYINLSIQLMERLLPILENQISVEERKINFSKEKAIAKVPLKVLRSGRLRAILLNCYLAIAEIFILEKRYTEAIDAVNKGLESGADKYTSYASLAVAAYHQYGLEKAIEYTDKMDAVRKNTIVIDLNRAFFSIKKKQYDEAVKYYDSAKGKYKKANDEFLILKVLYFLNERFQEDKTELAYKYAIGVLTYNFLDKSKGKDKLLNFLQHAETNKLYAPMIEVTKKITKT